VRVFVENGALTLQAEGRPNRRLRYIGNDTFGADFDPTVRLIFTVANGRVTSAKLQQRGTTTNVIRRP
jgi:hypothetical protein